MKRVKFESVFINHLGNPTYCTEDEIKEQHIKHVLIPWFIIAKKFGLPEHLVKMISGILGKYHECSLWKTIKIYCAPQDDNSIPFGPSKPVINTHRQYDFRVKNKTQNFEFYIKLINTKLSNNYFELRLYEKKYFAIVRKRLWAFFYFEVLASFVYDEVFE